MNWQNTGGIIVSRESIKDIRYGKLYYYVVEAKDGVIDPRFKMEGA